MVESTHFPAPRSGLIGLWDRLIGPGATSSENTLILASCVIGAIAATWRLASFNFDELHLLVGAFMGFDIIGGAVCNATDTTKRWYHRPEVSWVQHLAFVLPHLTYVGAVAWLFQNYEGFDWHYFSTISLCLLLAASTVLVTPANLKRPVAAALYLVAVAVGLYGVSPTAGLEWFIPALFLKLLIGHLVPEQLRR